MAPDPEWWASEPPRIRKFRLQVADAIPLFPNTRDTLRYLHEKSLGTLLIDYIHWQARYVGIRPRKIIIGPDATTDSRWRDLSGAVAIFLEKVRRGDDLGPHLSLAAHTRGFTPAALAKGATSEAKWSDKDFLLTASGYHHFHLGTALRADGTVERTNDLLFAHVTRDFFTVIALTDHSVFDWGAAERKRLFRIRERYTSGSHPPGTVVVDCMIASSGHMTHLVHYAGYCARLIRQVDATLDDMTEVATLYGRHGATPPRRPRFMWGFRHLDLALVDRATNTVFWMAHGST